MRITSIISIIVSTLFLIDYSVGGIFWDAFNVSEFTIHIHKVVATFHASLLLINIILIIQAEYIARELDINFNRVIFFILGVFLMARILFYPNLIKTVDKMYSKTKYGTELPKN